MTVFETERLRLSHLSETDASFIFELLTDPSFRENIGDRGVHEPSDAIAYILNGPTAMIAEFGYGLFRTALKSNDTPIGICGLLKRPTLAHADVGFALLPRFWGQGYASEAARASLEYGRDAHGMKRILAITKPHNIDSQKVLEKIGMCFTNASDQPDLGGENWFYQIDF